MTSPPPDVVAFVRARLAEWEAAARATEHADGPLTLCWRPSGARHLTFDNGRGESYSSVRTGDWDRILIARDNVRGGPLAEHIALNDPAHVLAWVAAMRVILDLDVCLACDVERQPCDHRDDTRRALAAVWRTHPYYDPAWQPTEGTTQP